MPLVNRRPADVYVPKVPKVQNISQCEIEMPTDPKETLLFESYNHFIVLSEDTSIEPPREETEVRTKDPIEETIHTLVSPKSNSPGEVKTQNLSIIKEEPEILQEQIIEEECFLSRECLSRPDGVPRLTRKT